MKYCAILALTFLSLSWVDAEWEANCEIEGADRYNWLTYYTVAKKINDDHHGEIATYKTKNIQALTGQSSRYLTATFNKNEEIVTVFTSENFTKFEEEFDYNKYEADLISLMLDFKCSDGKSETLEMRQKVLDTNNHDPVLNKNNYEYNFGIIIPEDYELTKLLPIYATDSDFSNKKMYFSMDFNEYVILEYNGERDNYNKTKYTTTLKALKPIRPPFRQEFALVVTDGGDPARSTTVPLLIDVTVSKIEGETGPESAPHPPVFSQHLYFANYTSDGHLWVEELMWIKYGAEENTALTQSGYEEYFKVHLQKAPLGVLKIEKVKDIPEELFQKTNYIVIELEATNADISIPGRSAIIIRLQKVNEEKDGKNSDTCDATIYTLNTPLGNSLLMFCFILSGIFIIVVVNLCVFVWYFQDKRFNSQHDVQPIPIIKLEKPGKLPSVL